MKDFSSFDHFFDGVAAFDSEGKIIYCNEIFADLVGVSPNRMINKWTLSKLFIEIDEQPLDMSQMLTTEATNTRVVTYKTKSVERGTGQYRLVPLPNDKVTLFVMRDLTLEEKLKRKYHREMGAKDQKIHEMESLILLLQNTRLVKEPLALMKAFASHILQQCSLSEAYLISSEGKIQRVFLSGATDSTVLLDYLAKASLPSQYVTVAPADLGQFNIGFVPNLQHLVIVPIRAPNKSSYTMVLPIFAEATLDHVMIKTLAEQMSLMLENMALEKLSIYDDLTKIFNARYFREKLDHYTSYYSQLSLILLDIDFFKKINDTYGHYAGDLVLMAMGEVLRKIDIKDGVMARVGGEEFALLVPNKRPEEVLAIAESLANKIRNIEVGFEDKVLKITSSFGIAAWNPGKMEVRQFFKAADTALYDSKKKGRNQISVFKAA